MLEENTRIQKLADRFEALPSKYWQFDSSQKIADKDQEFPLWKISCGSRKADASTLILVGGVHGLERIGSQLCVSLLEKYFELSLWDPVFQGQLENLRMVFIPLVNPVGIRHFTRSNGNGVDLMRNSPIVATDKVPFLVGGQRFTNKLPWYQGQLNAPMEIESQFLIDAVETEVKNSKFAVSLDIHSGFGFKDQIWFPWAFTRKPFPKLDLMHILTEYFEALYPHHIYLIEPQSKIYCTHGDLWDHLLNDKIKSSHYLPLTLELGSWLWVKKNPLQIFNARGLFNPIKQHRMKRIFRRHQLLIDFLSRFLIYMRTENYAKLDFATHYQKGLKSWYHEHN